MPTILIEVLAVYLGQEENHFALTPGETYHLEIIFVRELRTVIAMNKDPEYNHQNFYSYASWAVFTESWDIVDVLF